MDNPISNRFRAMTTAYSSFRSIGESRLASTVGCLKQLFRGHSVTPVAQVNKQVPVIRTDDTGPRARDIRSRPSTAPTVVTQHLQERESRAPIDNDNSEAPPLETGSQKRSSFYRSSSFENSAYLNLEDLATTDMSIMESDIEITQQHLKDTYRGIANLFGIEPVPSTRQQLYSKTLEVIKTATPEFRKEVGDKLIHYTSKQKEFLIADTESLIFLLLSDLESCDHIETMFYDLASDRFRMIPHHRELLIHALIRGGETERAKHLLKTFCSDALKKKPVNNNQHLAKLFFIRAELAEGEGQPDLAVQLYEKSFALDKNYRSSFRLLTIATDPVKLGQLKQPGELAKKMVFYRVPLM